MTVIIFKCRGWVKCDVQSLDKCVKVERESDSRKGDKW